MNAGMGARRKHCFAVAPSQDSLNCGTDAGIVIDDENSRRRSGKTRHSFCVVQL
jgi:hypothetical protein